MNLDHALERIHQLETLVGLKDDFRPGLFSRSQMQILGMLLKRTCVSRDAIHAGLYGSRDEDDIPDIRTIDVMISHLRKLLAIHGIAITTIYGVGYTLDAANKAKLMELRE